MKKKLTCILLVDDDPDHNFLHRHLLEKMNCAEKIQIVKNGLEAMDFITTKTDEKYPHPALIFLDINMPKMNGWEFLEKYKTLNEEIKSKTILIMLTSSLNPDDKLRAETYKEVNGFGIKLLDTGSMSNILAEHFPEYL